MKGIVGFALVGLVGVGAGLSQSNSLSPAAVAAQAQGNPAAGVPAASGQAAPDITNTKAYPYGDALKMLEGKQVAVPLGKPLQVVPSVVAARQAAAASGGARSPQQIYSELNRTKQPKGANRRTEQIAYVSPQPLSPGAQAALDVGNAAKNESPMPTPGKDGRVLFTYGVGLPTIVCAPLRVCTVELQPGERITGQPAIGDAVRWELLPASSGSGEQTTPIVVLKPHTVGLDTNLVITTDKRTYYLRLLSQNTDYIARTAFTYKDDEDAKWKAYIAEQERKRQLDEAKQVVTPTAADAIDRLNFEYEIKGGNANLRPLRVFDDGVKTYIAMPAAVASRELPSLIVQNTRVKGEKGQEIVNYRVKDNLYIVDRLFDRAALLLGSGKAVDKVEIRRTAAPVNGGK